MLKVIKEIADRVNHFFLAPICVCSSRSCASVVSYMHSVTIFSKSFPSMFLRAIN